MTGLGIQSFMAVALVLALVGALAWIARRGALGRLGTRGAISIETAVPLGERRSLAVVVVEGRRLLLGLTPASVTLVTELEPPAVAEPAAAQPAPGSTPFERELETRS